MIYLKKDIDGIRVKMGLNLKISNKCVLYNNNYTHQYKNTLG